MHHRHREPGLDARQLRQYGENLGTFWRTAAIAIILVYAVMAFWSPAHAQTTPSMTFGASVTNANGSLTTNLNWATTPAATSCTASGSPAWTGTKPASGTFALPTITMSGTYNLSLVCTWPGDNTATLTWTAPTSNTDGTALAKCPSQTTVGPCLRSFTANHGTVSGTWPDVVAINDANATTYTWTGLSAATHYFVMSAVNGLGVASVFTPEVSKVVSISQTQTSSVTLTVNPIPNAPTGLTIR